MTKRVVAEWESVVRMVFVTAHFAVIVPAAAASASTRARSLFPPRNHPHHTPGTVEDRIRQGHPTPALVERRESHVRVGDVEDRVSGDKGCRVPVRSQAEVDQVKDRRLACDFREDLSVVDGRGFQVGRLHRHGVRLVQSQRRMVEQAFAQVTPVAVGVSGGGDALIDLGYMDRVPGHIFTSQRAEH